MGKTCRRIMLQDVFWYREGKSMLARGIGMRQIPAAKGRDSYGLIMTRSPGYR
jgi:hypothetical protein